MAVEFSPLFCGVPPHQRNRLLALARAKEFARGQRLYGEGDPIQQILLLTYGFAKISKLGISGSEVILTLSVPGDVLAAVTLFTNGEHRATAYAFRSCRALIWEAHVFKSVVEEVPLLYRNIVRVQHDYLLELEERFREVATERVGHRVACQLVRLVEKIGQRGDGACEIGLAREELAQMTGTTMYTVSRLLSAWEARGMVKPGRESVIVCDVQSLRRVSE